MSILVILIVVLVVGAGVFFLKGKKNSKPSGTNTLPDNKEYYGYTNPSGGNDTFP